MGILHTEVPQQYFHTLPQLSESLIVSNLWKNKILVTSVVQNKFSVFRIAPHQTVHCFFSSVNGVWNKIHQYGKYCKHLISFKKSKVSSSDTPYLLQYEPNFLSISAIILSLTQLLEESCALSMFWMDQWYQNSLKFFIFFQHWLVLALGLNNQRQIEYTVHMKRIMGGGTESPDPQCWENVEIW